MHGLFFHSYYYRGLSNKRYHISFISIFSLGLFSLTDCTQHRLIQVPHTASLAPSGYTLNPYPPSPPVGMRRKAARAVLEFFHNRDTALQWAPECFYGLILCAVIAEWGSRPRSL